MRRVLLAFTAICSLARAYSLVESGNGVGGGSFSQSGNTITWSMTTTGFNWSYSKAVNGAGDNPAYGVFMYKLTAFGGSTTGAGVFDVNPSYATSSSGSYSASNGDWYGAYIRVVSGGVTTDYRWQFQVSVSVNKYRVVDKNNLGVPIRLVAVKHSDGTTVVNTSTGAGYVEVAPGASFDVTWNLPAGETSVDIRVFTQSTYSDGVWLESGSWTNGQTLLSGAAGSTTPPANSLPVNSTTVQAAGAPAPTANNSTTTVWNSNTVAASTTTATALDKQTFREGVGKIELALGTGETVGDVTLASSGTNEVPDLDASAASATADLVPSAPTLNTSMTTTHEINYDLAVPSMLGVSGHTFHIHVDLSDYSGPVGVFRGICTSGLLLMFFFLTVARLKGAFAN